MAARWRRWPNAGVCSKNSPTNSASSNLLGQMNDALLDGGARLIVDRSWQYDFEGDDDSDFDELTDEILYTLYWHDGDPIELEVRVGIDGDDAGYVKVEDEEIDDNAESIQKALLNAFRDIAEIDEVNQKPALDFVA